MVNHIFIDYLNSNTRVKGGGAEERPEERPKERPVGEEGEGGVGGGGCLRTYGDVIEESLCELLLYGLYIFLEQVRTEQPHSTVYIKPNPSCNQYIGQKNHTITIVIICYNIIK